MNTLFTNARIIRADGSVTHGCLGVMDDTIAFVGGVPADFVPQRRIDCDGDILIPGLVNTHTHLAMTLFRNAADDMELSSWLRDRIWPLEEHLTAEDTYWGSLLACAELIKGGCVAVNDMYFFMDQVAQALADSGMRGLIARSVISGDDGGFSRIEEAKALHREFNGAADDRIRVAISAHAEYTCSEETLCGCADAAQELRAPLHIHLSETYQEHEECKLRHQLTPLAYLSSLGMLHDRTLLAHCVHCDADDVALFGASRAHVLHCPQSNLKLGSGIAPVPLMLAHKVNISLGTDGAASNNNLDMFEEMRLAALLHKGVTMNATEVNARQALCMATANGAAALGFHSGMLEPGYKADVVRINTHTPAMLPLNDPVAAVVYSASTADVRLTMVNGRVLYEDGEFYTLDMDRIEAEVTRRKERYGL